MNSRPKKIWVASALTFSLTNFRGRLMQDLVEAGHEVIASGPETDPDIVDKLTKLGVRFVHTPLNRASFNPFSDLGYLWNLRRHFRRERVDVFLGYTKKPVIYGLWAAWLARVPTRVALITGLGYAFDGDASWPIRTVIRVLYSTSLRLATAVVFQNPDDRAFFVDGGFVSAKQDLRLVNGSGVDLTHYTASQLPSRESEVTFLMIARLLESKGVRDFANSARAIRRRYPQARFQLMGATEDQAAAVPLEEVQAWDRAGDVEFLGHIKDVRPYLEKCHVFVLPSRYREGTPRTALEALAIGRPVITTDVPGCRTTVVDQRNGFLITPGSPEALERALSRFLDEPELMVPMAQESLRLAKERFDVVEVNRAMRAAMGNI